MTKKQQFADKYCEGRTCNDCEHDYSEDGKRKCRMLDKQKTLV